MTGETERKRTWEDWAWRGLLAWNLLAVLYLLLRTPSVDATVVFRITLYADGAAVLWNLGRVAQILWARWKERRLEKADDLDTQPATATGTSIDSSPANQE